jgi:hypothetical protein
LGVVACVIIYSGELVIFYLFHYIYHLFISVKNRSPAARRRRQQEQEKEYRFQHRPVNEIGSDLTKISRPPKPYQIFDVDADSPTYSNRNNNNYSRLETSSSIMPNSIQLEMIKKSTPSNCSISTKTKDNPKETDSLFNTNRAQSRITVTRISNTKRRQSTSNERKIRQLRSFKVPVTRVKK